MLTISLEQAIIANGKVIPAGTELQFDAAGLACYEGMMLDINKLPEAAVEATIRTKLADMPTKGTLAMKALIAHIAVVLDNIQDIDKPELLRVLRIASQSVSSGGTTFVNGVGQSKYTL